MIDEAIQKKAFEHLQKLRGKKGQEIVYIVEVDRNRNLQALTRNLPGRRLPG